MSVEGVRSATAPLQSVRVHSPGLELWTCQLEQTPGLSEGAVGPDRIRREHERLVSALESTDVAVHQFADDLAAAGQLDDLVREHVQFPGDDAFEAIVERLGSRERLGLALSRARLDRTEKGATTIHVDRPLSRAFCQRETTIPGEDGPILAAMGHPRRGRERPFVAAAWAGTDAPPIHRVDGDDGPVEGSDYLPLGDRALLGLAGVVDGEETTGRTSMEAGRRLLDADVLGVPEVALVRTPLGAARARFEGHPRSPPGPLTAWCNVAASDLAVLDASLARHADVDVYVRSGGEYERERSTTLLSYLESAGYDWIDVGAAERWPTQFLPIEDGVVVPTFEPANDGTYHPELNPTIEALVGRGVTVHPDGEGVPGGALAALSGGVHAMTCPIVRG